jgi:large subunit ribosomal protein L40
MWFGLDCPTNRAEPLKKKKRIDPAILKAREDRKKRKIEKAIRRLEKMAKQLKPIDEMHVSYKLKQEIP